jgi:hypothetical protein
MSRPPLPPFAEQTAIDKESQLFLNQSGSAAQAARRLVVMGWLRPIEILKLRSSTTTSPIACPRQ